jgi:hypothetical protein
MFGHPVIGRIGRRTIFGFPAFGATVQTLSCVDIIMPVIGGKPDEACVLQIAN